MHKSGVKSDQVPVVAKANRSFGPNEIPVNERSHVKNSLPQITKQDCLKQEREYDTG